MASCVRVRAPSQAALSHALMTELCNVGAGMRVCVGVQSSWPALGEGESSKGVTSGWEAIARPPSAVRPIAE